MAAPADSDTIQRFITAVQVMAGRLLDAAPKDLPALVRTLADALPDELNDASSDAIVRQALVAAICRIEVVRTPSPDGASTASRILGLCAATSAGELKGRLQQYEADLERVERVIAPTAVAPDRRVDRALQFIAANAGRAGLTLGQVAEDVRLSKWHLDRLLRRHTGACFRSHLRRARMRHASRLLAEGLLTVKEIAACVGYSSVAELDRQFKRSFQATPTEWRARESRLANGRAGDPELRSIRTIAQLPGVDDREQVH